MEIQPDLEGHTEEVWCVNYSHDGNNIVSGEGYDVNEVSGSRDFYIKIWNFEL